MAGTVFGVLAAITARGLNRWTQALIVATCGMAIIAISFSRLYLGVNWFSDVAGGVLIGTILSVIFSVAIATINLRRFHPLALLATSVFVLFIATSINIDRNFERREDRYQPIDKLATFSLADYLADGWGRMPGQRINLIGKPGEGFNVQWVGTVPSLRNLLSQHGYHLWNRWGWRDTLAYLNTHNALADMAPKPAVHEGLQAKVTATVKDPLLATGRIVLKAFQSNTVVKDGDHAGRVYLIDLRQESLKTNLGMFALPATRPVNPVSMQAIIQQLAEDPGVENLGQKSINGQTITILRPKS